jgi:hypothetical protein
MNALADRAPGFVWRLQDESGNATAFNPFGDPSMIVNMSVWASIEALFAFVYQTGHTAIMRQRKAWFEKPAAAHMALWWIAAGTLPSAQEGKERLSHLRTHGPGPFAFSFKQRCAPPAIAA